jgi:site-specific recombinase XerD
MIDSYAPSKGELVEVAHAALVAEIVTDPTAVGSAGLFDYLRSLPQEDLLDALTVAVDEHKKSLRVENTAIAYAKDWTSWSVFCETLGVGNETVSGPLFYVYVEYLIERELAPASISRMLAGAIVGLRDRGHAIASKGGPAHDAWLRIRKYEVDLREANEKRGRGQATAVTLQHVVTICDSLPLENLYGLRDKAILLIGLSIASRRRELSQLLDTDIVVDPLGRGMNVTVRATKGGKFRTVAVPYAPEGVPCPVRAWSAWRTAAGIVGGPAFRRIYGQRDAANRLLRVDDAGLSPQTINLTVKALGALAGVDLDLTGHSLRAGRVTIALGQGHDVGDVCEISGHSPKSGTVYDYRRAADRWTNSANVLGF